MRLAVIGGGYVGLVTAACFAEQGNDVTVIDIDPLRIAQLQVGKSPIYEPGLEELIQSCQEEGTLKFTTDYAVGLAKAQVVILAVGTPQAEDGSSDMRYIEDAAFAIGMHLDQYAVIATKSTVPVGTGEIVWRMLANAQAQKTHRVPFDVVSIPEFLKEGTALSDFRRPDRIVIGVDSPKAKAVMEGLYGHFVRGNHKLYWMSLKDAELVKYAANAMLALRISFMNEIAGICDAVGADVENVRLGVGSDSRIGFPFLYAGAGYGGSCFPKDVRSLAHKARQNGLNPHMIESADRRNEDQKYVMPQKIRDVLGPDLRGKVIAIWGLTFKPDTDDLREASSLVLARELLSLGASLQVHDPVAMHGWMSAMWEEGKPPPMIRGYKDRYEALEDANCLVLMTEWKVYRSPDFDRMRVQLIAPLIFDGRNQYDPAYLKSIGFTYVGVGRRN